MSDKTTPFQECTQYETCSCNVCPLDPDASQRIALPGESGCGASRRVRTGIATRYPELLPGGGLLPREVARDARKAAFSALPEDHPRKVGLRLASAKSSLFTVAGKGKSI